MPAESPPPSLGPKAAARAKQETLRRANYPDLNLQHAVGGPQANRTTNHTDAPHASPEAAQGSAQSDPPGEARERSRRIEPGVKQGSREATPNDRRS
eukprot:2244512-Alexandrium_andersonii.AAC.1